MTTSDPLGSDLSSTAYQLCDSPHVTSEDIVHLLPDPSLRVWSSLLFPSHCGHVLYFTGEEAEAEWG